MTCPGSQRRKAEAGEEEEEEEEQQQGKHKESTRKAQERKKERKKELKEKKTKASANDGSMGESSGISLCSHSFRVVLSKCQLRPGASPEAASAVDGAGCHRCRGE